MDEWTTDYPRDNNKKPSYPKASYPKTQYAKTGYPRADGHQGGGEDRGNRYGAPQHGDPNTNKIRRGPGRRLAKEKRFRSMDPALMQKYSQLPSALQEKVNAAIEIYYQQQMAKAYKNQGSDIEPEQDDDGVEEDVIYDADEPLET